MPQNCYLVHRSFIFSIQEKMICYINPTLQAWKTVPSTIVIHVFKFILEIDHEGPHCSIWINQNLNLNT